MQYMETQIAIRNALPTVSHTWHKPQFLSLNAEFKLSDEKSRLKPKFTSYKCCSMNMFFTTPYVYDNKAMETEWASFTILLLLKKHLQKQAGNGAGKRTRKGLALFEIKFPLVAVVMTFYHPCSSPPFLVRLFSPFPTVVSFFYIPIPFTLMWLGKKIQYKCQENYCIFRSPAVNIEGGQQCCSCLGRGSGFGRT